MHRQDRMTQIDTNGYMLASDILVLYGPNHRTERTHFPLRSYFGDEVKAQTVIGHLLACEQQNS